jgi:DNA-binding NtrC family response regulator
VGKHLAALAIHRQSRRAGGNFVHVNCRAMPTGQFAAKLSGLHPGLCGCAGAEDCLLDRAHRGTLFLANVEALPPWVQVRLSDTLRMGPVDCRGAIRSERLDVRLIASTSCDLEAAVIEGRFDPGLYYLLSAISLPVPPLRERPQDLKILADRCLEAALVRQGVAADQARHRFSQEACRCLLSHDWPGNLPELAAAVTRAVALSDGEEIKKESFSAGPRQARGPKFGETPISLSGTLREIERHVVEEVIHRCRGNKAEAARSLGLHRRTLYRILDDDADTGEHESCEDSSS